MAQAVLQVIATDFPKPNIDHLITEDDEPVDNIFSEKQQRLLTDPLFSSWSGAQEGKRDFVAVTTHSEFGEKKYEIEDWPKGSVQSRVHEY